jgi:hypothetical protein
MGKMILIEEFHVTVYAPQNLPATEHQAIHTTLSRRQFHARLSQTIRTVIGQYPSLKKTRVKLSK